MDDFKPMLCHTAPGKPPQVPEGEGWVMERKQDGWRFLFHVRTGGVMAYSGRNGRKYGNTLALVGIENVLGRLPLDTIIDGELIVEGDSAASVSTALAGHGGRVTFIAFDLIRVAGHDIRGYTFGDRRRLLEKAAEGFDGKVVKLSEVVPVDQAVYEGWVAEGWEGAVVKRLSGRYRSGKRSWDQMKLKPQTTIEATVIGLVQGKNGISNDIGALTIELVDTGVITSVGCPPWLSQEILQGKTFAQEAAAAELRWRDRMIEVLHMGMFEGGVPRHPIFKQLRPDRDAVN